MVSSEQIGKLLNLKNIDVREEEYYLEIDGYKIFYNAIFDFGKARNWR